MILHLKLMRSTMRSKYATFGRGRYRPERTLYDLLELQETMKCEESESLDSIPSMLILDRSERVGKEGLRRGRGSSSLKRSLLLNLQYHVD